MGRAHKNGCCTGSWKETGRKRQTSRLIEIWKGWPNNGGCTGLDTVEHNK